MQKKNHEVVKLLIAVICISVFYVMPTWGTLSRSAMALIGIFIGSVFLWITVGISWPSLFCLLALSFLPELSMNTLVKDSFGNPAIIFLVFTFCCSHALNRTLFTRRCAIWFLSTRIAKKGPWAFLALYFLSVLVLGSCMSTTVIVVLYLTINEEIFSVLEVEKGDKYAALMTMGLVITASISGAMTPIGHAFPMVGLSIYNTITGNSISYIDYMIAGIPAALLVVGVMILIFRFVLRPDTSRIQVIDTDVLKTSLQPADKKEKIIVTVFFSVVALWVFPELLKNVSSVFAVINNMGTVMPPLLGTMILCILRNNDEPLLDLGEGLKAVPWPSMFMAAAAMAIGGALTNADIGVSAFIESHLGPFANTFQGILFVIVLVAVTGFMTNVGSNMVTVTIMSTVTLPVAMATNGVNVGALAVVLGMMSSYAFATPPAMTTVALATGTGWTTNSQMAKYGFLVLIPSILVVALIAYPIAAQLV